MGEISCILCSHISQNQGRWMEERMLNAPPGRILSVQSQLLCAWDKSISSGVQVSQLQKHSSSHLTRDICQDPEFQASGVLGLLWFCTEVGFGAEPRSSMSLCTEKPSLLHRVTVWKEIRARAHQQLRGSENGWGHCWGDMCVSLIGPNDAGQERRCRVWQDCRHAGLL